MGEDFPGAMRKEALLIGPVREEGGGQGKRFRLVAGLVARSPVGGPGVQGIQDDITTRGVKELRSVFPFGVIDNGGFTPCRGKMIMSGFSKVEMSC